MGAVSLTLPYPPTVNHYWRAARNQGGALTFVICEAGKRFRKEVGQLAMLERVQARTEGTKLPLRGKLFVSVFVHPPDLRKRDLDNLLKPLLDSLQHAGVILDDFDVTDLLIKRCSVKRPGRVHVTVQESI